MKPKALAIIFLLVGLTLTISFQNVGRVFASQPTILQMTSCTSATSACTTSTFGSSVTANDEIIVGVAFWCGSGTVTTAITDSKGNSPYNLAIDSGTANYGNLRALVYYGQATTGGSSFTVTATLSSCTTPKNLNVVAYELSGFNALGNTAKQSCTGCIGATLSTSSMTFDSTNGLLFTSAEDISCSAPGLVKSGSGWTTTANAQSGNWGGTSYSGSQTSPTTAGWTCTAGTNWADVVAEFDGPIQSTQPIKATLTGSGSAQTITFTGCHPSPSSISGDGASHNVVMDSNCSMTMSLPVDYHWSGTGTSTEIVTSCNSGTCTLFADTYVTIFYYVTITCTFFQLQCWWYPFLGLMAYAVIMIAMGALGGAGPRGMLYLLLVGFSFASMVEVMMGMLPVTVPFIITLMTVVYAWRMK